MRSFPSTAIQSVSDQTDFRLNAIIAAACASAVTPEQAADLELSFKGADEEETIFNMVTVLLLRIHQSGCLHEISSAGFAIGQRRHCRVQGAFELTFPEAFLSGRLGCRALATVGQRSGLDCGANGYLAVWRFEGERRSAKITLPAGTKKQTFKCIYPAGAVSQVCVV
mgnify:CR=1 FL=1